LVQFCRVEQSKETTFRTVSHSISISVHTLCVTEHIPRATKSSTFLMRHRDYDHCIMLSFFRLFLYPVSRETFSPAMSLRCRVQILDKRRILLFCYIRQPSDVN